MRYYSRSAGRAEIITRFHLTNFFRTLKMFPVVPKSKVCIIRSLRTNNTPTYLTPRLGSPDLCIALLMGGATLPPPISNRPQSIALTASFPDRGPVLDMTVCLYQVAVVRYSVAGRPLGSALGISGGMLLMGGATLPPPSVTSSKIHASAFCAAERKYWYQPMFGIFLGHDCGVFPTGNFFISFFPAVHQ